MPEVPAGELAWPGVAEPARPSFVAVSFEFANNESASICAAGVARIVDGQLVRTTWKLVWPAPPHLYLYLYEWQYLGEWQASHGPKP